VDLEVRGAGVVDEAGGPANVHSVTNVLAGDELWVEPDLIALGVVFDCPFALFDLLGVPFDLIGVKFEELCFGNGIWFLKFIEVHQVIAFIWVSRLATSIGLLGRNDLTAVGVDKLSSLQTGQTAQA